MRLPPLLCKTSPLWSPGIPRTERSARVIAFRRRVEFQVCVSLLLSHPPTLGWGRQPVAPARCLCQSDRQQHPPCVLVCCRRCVAHSPAASRLGSLPKRCAHAMCQFSVHRCTNFHGHVESPGKRLPCHVKWCQIAVQHGTLQRPGSPPNRFYPRRPGRTNGHRSSRRPQDTFRIAACSSSSFGAFRRSLCHSSTWALQCGGC